MTKYFFILGRNPELSRAEVISYLEARKRKIEQVAFEENYLILEIQGEIPLNIQNFGGILKIGKILFEGSEVEVNAYISEKDLVPSEKFSYSVYGNLDEEPFKEKFKNEKRKAMLRHGRANLKFQDGEQVGLPKTDVSFFLHEVNKIIYYGLVEQEYDYTNVKKRDMDKPFRREELAISPRLAKILINLSQTQTKQLLLDPFCGVGSILQEALAMDINVFGSDIDNKAIKQAVDNIRWLTKNYKIETKSTIRVLDANSLPDLQFQGVATETPLGKLVKKKPQKNEAEQIIHDFESFIIPILRKIKKVKKPTAKIAITFPAIDDVRVDLERIQEKTGLKLHNTHFVQFPIREFRPKQFISRDIVVLE